MLRVSRSSSRLEVIGAEVGQGVVVHRHVAGDPLVGDVVAAEAVELAGAMPTPSTVA